MAKREEPKKTRPKKLVEEPSFLEKARAKIAEWTGKRILERRAVRRRRRIVITFGRMNPPTKGHQLVLQAMVRLANSLKAEALVFTSHTQDARKNPLTFDEKLKFLRKLWPGMNFYDGTDVRTPLDALAFLARLGYQEVYLVVGSDRGELQRLAQYVAKPDGPKRTPTDIELAKFEVVPIPRTTDISGTAVRTAVVSGDWASFQQMVPGSVSLKRELWTAMRDKMVKRDIRNQAFLVYGATPESSGAIMEALSHLPVRLIPAASVDRCRPLPLTEQVAIDVSGLGVVDIKMMHGFLEHNNYGVTFYVQNAAKLNESVERVSTYGAIRELFARDVVDVVPAAVNETSRVVWNHARKVLKEAEGGAKPKQPSEVDRLKISQQKELLLTKQRQGQQMLAAKTRELEKKSREDAQKITNGAKPKAVSK